MDVKTYWNNVKSLIKLQNTTQEWVAKTCGISYRTLQNWISRNISPDIITSVRIAKALNTTVEYLVTGKEPVKPDTTALIQEAEELVEKLKQL